MTSLSTSHLSLGWWVLPPEPGIEVGSKVLKVATSGLHVLFGPNNTGKSRLLRLLPKAGALMELPWDVVAEGGSILVRDAHAWATQYDLPPLLAAVQIKKTVELSLHGDTVAILENLRLQLGSRVSDLVAALNQRLSILSRDITPPLPMVYIGAHRFLKATSPIGNDDGDATNPDQMVQVLSRLNGHADKDRRDRFERIQAIFTAISGTSFFLRQSQLWTVHISEPGTIDERPLEQCGDGLRDLLGLILRIEEVPHHPVLVDEPGVRLHPRAQRALLRYLVQASDTRPIWIATHDGVFIGSPDVSARYSVSRANNVTSARRVSSPRDLRMAFSELGWNPRDALLCDVVLFCEGRSDKEIFRHLLEEPRHPHFQGVEVVELGGDRIWGTDSKRLLTLIDTVRGIAPHSRFCALLDRGGHTDAECNRAQKILSEKGIEVRWLRLGELENYWLADRQFLTSLCEALARTKGTDPSLAASAVAAESPEGNEKGSKVIERILDRMIVRASKVEIAAAASLMIADGKGNLPKSALLSDLSDLLQPT